MLSFSLTIQLYLLEMKRTETQPKNLNFWNDEAEEVWKIKQQENNTKRDF